MLYEINTWVWLAELSAKFGPRVELGSVPEEEWDAIAHFGFDAVWLMGVWERSPLGIAIANQNPSLLEDFRRALPDFQTEDNVGSPYCVRKYVVDTHLGGREGLAVARDELGRRGMKLILDFVPNHVAPDHPWVGEHPEYFIQGTPDDARNDPASFTQIGGTVFACGRDPYFPAWSDVLQVNAFHPGLRQAAIDTVRDLAGQCDGVRCDMAMLLLNSVFERTWGERAGSPPATEYWTDLIPAIKKTYPDFKFIAEAYWDLEWDLQQLRFDFCYDKRLYDRLEHDSPESVRLHLGAGMDYQSKLLRFLENHDEPRAASAFSPAKERAAAVVTSTLPGALLFHAGQYEGRRVRLPVFLGRRPAEPLDKELQNFYTGLLAAIDAPVFRNGQWVLCERSGWPDNVSFQNLVAWAWAMDGERYLIVVNLSDAPAQARVMLPWTDVAGKDWQLTDAFSGMTYDRQGKDMRDAGLYVDLAPWGYHFFHCQSVAGTEAIRQVTVAGIPAQAP
jgi:hypothetical protein